MITAGSGSLVVIEISRVPWLGNGGRLIVSPALMPISGRLAALEFPANNVGRRIKWLSERPYARLGICTLWVDSQDAEYSPLLLFCIIQC